LPTPTPPFDTSFCIYHVGDPAPATCPSGSAYANYHVYYSGRTDDRGCSACACSNASPGGGSCSGAIDVFSDTTCLGLPATSYAFPSPSCQMYSIGTSPTRVVGRYLETAGACSVGTNPRPTGAVQGTGATVVCCLP
jgi:hypothetical protein